MYDDSFDRYAYQVCPPLLTTPCSPDQHVAVLTSHHLVLDRYNRYAYQMASEACEPSHASSPSSIRVAPQRGAALLFWSADREQGRGLEQMWHAGCKVRRGAKWTLQKFKERPR